MPPHLHEDRATAQPEPGAVDALISQARQLRGRVDAVRRDAADDTEDPRQRWQRALCDLAVHQLDDLGEHLGQLREGLPGSDAAADADPARGRDTATYPPPETFLSVPAPGRAAVQALGRAGSAEWDLVTDGVEWSDELYRIFGRQRHDGPLTLDELPTFLFAEDQPVLSTAVTGCLVDARPIDCEFRIVRPDGAVRTVHMVGEPVLDAAGATASMWAVLRDVSELRRSQRTLRETRDSLQRERQIAQTEHRLAVELQEAVLPPWRGSLRFPQDGGPPAVDLAAHYLPSATSALIGGDWYDALQLPDGSALLTVGDLTGHGVSATSGMAMLLGALRGMAVAGLEPGPLMGWLNQMLDSSAQPALGSALCCRYHPADRRLVWSQAGHPAPLLFRDGTGRQLEAPEGVLLGATAGAQYGQAALDVMPGDLLVLHTDGLTPRRPGRGSAADASAGVRHLLELGPRFAQARTPQECVRIVVEELGAPEREDDACVLIAKFH
ncbi:PP2C family protein-serine/threonine phosphatase [Streptomyces sp. MI02-7b]|uniref:PP2C family protein-serine/threonine phosphatase n=1 Tax=Streptomyces sp. MI02-7b TaxID=462941 RepID=UPI0029A144AB|nr:SpoIIE family protein phosphatase [Streptomyces sp. MI02-7b]MDX3078464.1 SpoIIE family protein phosphatase [Streptomyces sp. MI02-7b]